MENMSTPIANKKLEFQDANVTVYNSDFDEDEQITLKNKLNRCDSPFFDNISPIDHNINKSRVIKSNLEKEESYAVVHHNPFQDDDASTTSSEELDSDSISNCSSVANYSILNEIDVKDVKDRMMEMSQAVHKYINKIKHINIPVKWELPSTLVVGKGIRKSESGLKGPLDPEEISFMKKRLRQFCEEYKINHGAIRACLADKVSKFHFPNELRLKFVQYLCKDYVDGRNPLTVFRAISKLGIRKGKFSEEEENFLVDMYHNYNGSYLHSVCGLMLNRHRSQIFKKFERLKKKGSLGLRPSLDSAKTKPLKLRNNILKNILNRRNFNLERLRHRLNTRSWTSIGKEYNVSPALAKAIFLCEIFPQIFAVHPVKFNSFFAKMLYRIKRSDWNTWEEVKWKELSSLLYDVGPVFVYVMLRKIIMRCVPKEKWSSFKECAEYLHQNLLPYFENGPKKVTLNKILIQSGEMMVED